MSEIGEAQNRLENIRTSITEFAQNRGAFKTQVLEKIRDINEKINQITGKIQELQGSAQEVQRLRQQNEVLTGERDAFKNNVDRLTEENTGLKGEIQTKNTEIQRLTAERDQLLNVKQGLETQISNLTQEIVSSRAENAELKRQLDELNIKLENISSRIQELERLLEEREREKTALEAELVRLRGDLDKANADLTQANTQIQNIQENLALLIQDIKLTFDTVNAAIASIQQTDDPEIIGKLTELQNQVNELIQQLGLAPIQNQPQNQPQQSQRAPSFTEEEKKQMFSRPLPFKVPFPEEIPNTFDELKANSNLRQRLINLMNISRTYIDNQYQPPNNVFTMPDISNEYLTESSYGAFKSLYKAYLQYWSLTPTRGGRSRPLKKQKRKTLKKQKKYTYMKGGWVYKGDLQLDSESTVISESRSGSRSKSKSKSKSGNKRKSLRKSVRKFKNKGLTRKRNRNRK